jgi:hypothetical protein
MAMLLFVMALMAASSMGTEVALIELDGQTGRVSLGLRLAEAKAASRDQTEIVPARVMIAGECRRTCAACGHLLPSKEHYTATFRSLFRATRQSGFSACSPVPSGYGGGGKKLCSFEAPELAYVTARVCGTGTFLARFSQTCCWNLLPVSGAHHAGKFAIGRCGLVACRENGGRGGAVVVGLDGDPQSPAE